VSELVSIDQCAARLSVTVGTTRHWRPRGVRDAGQLELVVASFID
jgi:hypothetical protein